MINFSILINYFDMFLEGFKITLFASFLALIGSFVLGAIIAIFRIAPFKPLNFVGAIYVEFIRNIPLLLIVFVFYMGFRLGGFTAGTLGLIVYTAAFIAEAIRAGIKSIAKGQMEAARSSGLTYLQAMWHVILPQAVKMVIPPLGNQTLNLVKNSSILGVVGGLDLMYYGDLINSQTFAAFSTYIFVGLFYLVLTIPLSFGVRYLEKRVSRSY
ncbi:amino acid ABC transporter permease [Alkalihalobacillus sp. FSL R5-0424]